MYLRSSGFGKLALQEVKSAEDHSVIVWCNLTTCGVLPATKYDFSSRQSPIFLQLTSAMVWQSSFTAIVHQMVAGQGKHILKLLQVVVV